MMRGQQTPSIFIMMFTTVAIFAIAAVPVATAGQSKAAEIADLGAAHEGGGALGINNHGQPTELILVVVGVHNTSRREAVEYKGRNSHCVEPLSPVVYVTRNASRAVNQHNRGQAIGSGLWNPQFPGEDDRLSFLFSGQELLIGQGGGLKRVQLHSRHFCTAKFRAKRRQH